MVAWKLNEQKRQHRERSQPLNRSKLGLLEKHSDYVKRARDYHSKEDRIKKLKEKAATKNKDEFYFGMIKARTVKGVHMQSRGNVAMDHDLVKVLKTQDAGYIRTQQAIEQGRVRRLQQQLDSLIDDALDQPKASTSAEMMGDDEMMDDWDSFDLEPVDDHASANSSGRKHIVFSDDLGKVRTVDDPTKILPKKKRSTFKTLQESTTSSKKGKSKAVAEPTTPPTSELLALAKAHRTKLETELTARRARLDQFALALKELENQRLLMGKGAKTMIVAKKKNKDARVEEDWKGDKTVEMEEEKGIASGARLYKWKAQRKR